uniref:subtilisin n=1 Tax=Mucochytrium quahogii TaxID=96639 RepID=A0A7S2S354_9STRA|mmetsp:Transcript_18866/g.30843  ORF Transcript_18866/g.30843 Transcript_18866/m.30843 type:complete len:445 (-) Transcript_18866:39-1373(-)
MHVPVVTGLSRTSLQKPISNLKLTMYFIVQVTLLCTLGVANAFSGDRHFNQLKQALAGEQKRGLFLAKVAGNQTDCKQVQEVIDAQDFEYSPSSQVISVHDICFVSFRIPSPQRRRTDVEFVKQLPKVEYLENLVFTHAQSSQVSGCFPSIRFPWSSCQPRSWGLDRIDQPNLPLNKKPFHPVYTGVGVTIYTLDTGINKEHQDFGGRANLGADFVNEGFVEDRNGHGTHCAGTAAGKEYGVAKDAVIVAVKVLSQTGIGKTDSLLYGLGWAVEHARDVPAVINLSVGVSTKSRAVDEAVNAASRAGHIVVVAAGSDGEDACGRSPSGTGKVGPLGGVISVGATDKNDQRSPLSNHNCTDIYAPGIDISSLWIGSAQATRRRSGTSVAAAHVSGVAAMLLQKHNMQKEMAQKEMFSIAAQNQITNLTKPDEARFKNLLLQIPRL